MDIPHLARRQLEGPPQHWQAAARLWGVGVNARLATLITSLVGTMWCAYIFAAIALISLPYAIHSGVAAVISWIAQTFIQLVLLSIIMVGQNISAAASDARAVATFNDADAILTLVQGLEKHLTEQDKGAKVVTTSSDSATSPDILP
jgi:hypothetical protein